MGSKRQKGTGQGKAPAQGGNASGEEEVKLGEEAYGRGEYEQALGLLLPWAQQGNPSAQYLCGVMYDKGEGVAEDLKRALYWYEKAAGQGMCEAQLACGQMYDKGLGSDVNEFMALRWYEAAAAQGSREALYK